VQRFEAGDIGVGLKDLARRGGVIQFNPGAWAGVVGVGSHLQAGDAFREVHVIAEAVQARQDMEGGPQWQMVKGGGGGNPGLGEGEWVNFAQVSDETVSVGGVNTLGLCCCMGSYQRNAGVHQLVRVGWAEVEGGAVAVGDEADIGRISVAQDEGEREVADDDEAKSSGDRVAKVDGDGVSGETDG
jgi:hypothetical protein